MPGVILQCKAYLANLGQQQQPQEQPPMPNITSTIVRPIPNKIQLWKPWMYSASLYQDWLARYKSEIPWNYIYIHAIYFTQKSRENVGILQVNFTKKLIFFFARLTSSSSSNTTTTAQLEHSAQYLNFSSAIMANSNNINHTQIQIPHHPDSKPATNSITMVGATAEQVIIMKKRVPKYGTKNI